MESLAIHDVEIDPHSAAVQIPDWLRVAGAGVSIARFAGFDAEDRFLVATVVGEVPQPAASSVALREHDIGTAVVVALEGGDARRPIILGRLHQRRDAAPPLVARMNGDRLVLAAEREIELRCGEASIVLTRAGKVLIKGAYVLTRSSGANRIKGAYVDIN
jgi:hypothetical protein